MFLEKKTFNDFLTSAEGIASNILTNRLKSLMNDGLIDYKINPSNKKVKWYYLNDKALNCYPVIIEMVNWSNSNLSKTFGPTSIKWIKENTSDSNKIVSGKKISGYKKFRQFIIDNSLDRS